MSHFVPPKTNIGSFPQVVNPELDSNTLLAVLCPTISISKLFRMHLCTLSFEQLDHQLEQIFFVSAEKACKSICQNPFLRRKTFSSPFPWRPKELAHWLDFAKGTIFCYG
ncbi:hypothetical protein CEXT_160591 [Caerostris extrusa]|uniref:Uncharacterized protein n=1 Tax=Caerostris extrusa TaxID=172846 RepID=A0AAV4YEB2_CAEEX|nr:hypothetical protein CEXT_160591 [Caerostris extrusa]